MTKEIKIFDYVTFTDRLKENHYLVDVPYFMHNGQKSRYFRVWKRYNSGREQYTGKLFQCTFDKKFQYPNTTYPMFVGTLDIIINTGVDIYNHYEARMKLTADSLNSTLRSYLRDLCNLPLLDAWTAADTHDVRMVVDFVDGIKYSDLPDEEYHYNMTATLNDIGNVIIKDSFNDDYVSLSLYGSHSSYSSGEWASETRGLPDIADIYATDSKECRLRIRLEQKFSPDEAYYFYDNSLDSTRSRLSDVAFTLPVKSTTINSIEDLAKLNNSIVSGTLHIEAYTREGFQTYDLTLNNSPLNCTPGFTYEYNEETNSQERVYDSQISNTSCYIYTIRDYENYVKEHFSSKFEFSLYAHPYENPSCYLTKITGSLVYLQSCKVTVKQV